MEEERNFDEKILTGSEELLETISVQEEIIEEKIEPVIQKTKFHGGKKHISYLASGIAGAFIGGMIMAGAALYVLPKTGSFNGLSQNKTMVSQVSGNKVTNLSANYLSTTKPVLSVIDIAKKVGPAVVGITATSQAPADPFGFTDGTQEDQGSGIIFSEDGYIVTNYHVVAGASTVKVMFNTGTDGKNKEVNAKVVNYDQDQDLAVIKITDKTDIPGVAEFGDSDKLQVGEQAVAIGNPMGTELIGSVTAGVISALNRQIDVEGNGVKHTFIQTDAAINSGNSGGALVNEYGEVVGINSAKIGGSGVEGLGFSIPINLVKPKLEELIKPLLKIGISGIEITSDLAKQNDLPVGIYVRDVTDFSAAQRSGIQSGDVIVKFDGQSVKTVSDLNKIKAKHKVGDIVKVEIVRNKENKTLDLKFIED